MPKLNQFILEVTTGTNPGPEHPKFSINGFPLEFDECEGSTEAGATLKAVGCPNSFPHSLVLKGPEEGQPNWDIEGVVATYECNLMEPYVVRMGAITLDDESDLNIWHEPPLPTFDV
ncbi:MAG: helicase [Candidatus Hydrogenedentota bacterium]